VLQSPLIIYTVGVSVKLRKTRVLQPGAAPGKARHPSGTSGGDRLTGTGNTKMERVTLRIPEQQIEAVEGMVETGKFPNRSEAIRAAVRDLIEEQSAEQTSSPRTYVKV